MSAVEDRALEWLRRSRPTAAEVRSIRAYGTDWAGGTEDGFHSESSVEITWTDGSGTDYWFTVDGEQFASLWDWMVARD